MPPSEVLFTPHQTIVQHVFSHSPSPTSHIPENSQKNKWEGVTELPQPRSSAGVCVLGGLLVIVGGSSDAVTSSKYCMAFDPKKGQWHQMASMNQNRNQAGVCSFNNHIYVAGGTDSWNCLSSVEVYDPKTDR